MAAQQAKVLRVGVIRSGKIVEERVLPPRESLTIGTGPRNALVVQDPALPESLTLFAWQGDRYLLAFGPDTQGRIQGPQGEADLQALAAQGQATRSGGGFVVPVRDDQRGRVSLGELTVLWQFVAAAPAAPQPALPRSFKTNHFTSMDRLFVTVLAVSFLLHGGLYAALAATDLPQKDLTLEEIPDRYARVLIPERQPEPPKLPEKGPEVNPEAKPEPVAEKKPEPEKKPAGGEAGPEGKAAHAAAVAKAVQSKGILKVLGALGPGTGRGAVADVFGTGGGVGDVASALAGAGGVAVATDPGQVGGGGRKGGGEGGAAQIGSLATSGGGGSQVGYGAKAEAKVSGSVAAEAAEVDSSEVDQGKLGAFVRARNGLLKACYENALKRNPGLKGKLRVRFTILETGGVSDLTVVENGLGSADVAACITNTMRAWRTQFRPTGPVTVEIPLYFSPGA